MRVRNEKRDGNKTERPREKNIGAWGFSVRGPGDEGVNSGRNVLSMWRFLASAFPLCLGKVPSVLSETKHGPGQTSRFVSVSSWHVPDAD